MYYVIKNYKNVYIKLNENGKAVTCGEHDKALFEYSKAKNIVNNLPKTLKRLKFEVESISDVISNTEMTRKIIQKENYVVPENVTQWGEKFKICIDILKEAEERKIELNKKLSDIDKLFVNIIHEIEFEGSIDLYGGWKERNRVKQNRETRRCIKDELFFISRILEMDLKNFDINMIDKMILELANRKFTYRVVEEEDIDIV